MDDPKTGGHLSVATKTIRAKIKTITSPEELHRREHTDEHGKVFTVAAVADSVFFSFFVKLKQNTEGQLSTQDHDGLVFVMFSHNDGPSLFSPTPSSPPPPQTRRRW
jgi:hypothetical protein